jgi:hypothetical protein
VVEIEAARDDDVDASHGTLSEIRTHAGAGRQSPPPTRPRTTAGLAASITGAAELDDARLVLGT